jgi:gliding motility-associated-like protein
MYILSLGFLFVLIHPYKVLGQNGGLDYIYNICSGDTATLGQPVIPDAFTFWEVPGVSIFVAPNTGDTVRAYYENNTTEILNFYGAHIKFFPDIGALVDSFLIRVHPPIITQCMPSSYKLCPLDTTTAYFQATPNVIPFLYPSYNTISDTSVGSPYIKFWPEVDTTYYLYFQNVVGCTSDSFPIQINVTNPIDTIFLDAPELFCASTEFFGIYNYFPPGGTLLGTGVQNDTLFSPQLAGPGEHVITYRLGPQGCFLTASDTIRVIDSTSVVFDDIPNLCINAEKYELPPAFPPGGVFVGPGCDGLFISPQLLEPNQSYTLTYLFEVEEQCTISKSIVFFIKAAPPEPEINFPPFLGGCIGDTLFLQCNTPASSYLWTTGSTTNSTFVVENSSVSLTLFASNGCETQSEPVFIGFGTPPEVSLESPLFPNNFNISVYGENDGSINLEVLGGTAPYSYQWSTGDVIEDLDSLFAGLYFVNVSDSSGCFVRDSIELIQPNIISSDSTLLIPNAFTPNGDGFNDLYVIRGMIPDHVENEFFVFDFRRQLVYSAQNYSNTWDGTDNDGKRLLTGTYYGVFKSNGLEKPFTTVIDLRYE